MYGEENQRYPFTELEVQTLRDLQRGVFAKGEIRKGERLDATNAFYAIPNSQGQIVANQMSKYTDFSRSPCLIHNTHCVPSATFGSW